MAKKTLIAKHRIALPKTNASAKEIKYAEPGTKFQIEADEADRLVSLGAAVEPKEEKSSGTKSSGTKSSKKDDDEGGDLV